MTQTAKVRPELLRTSEQPDRTGVTDLRSPIPFLICCAEVGEEEQLLRELLQRCGQSATTLDSPAGQDGGVDRSADIAAVLAEGDGHVGLSISWAEFATTVAGKPRPPGQKRRNRHREPWTTRVHPRVPDLGYVHVVRRDRQHLGAERAAQLREADWMWIGYFGWAQQPRVTVAYEDLVADPTGTVREVFEHLGADVGDSPDSVTAFLSGLVLDARNDHVEPTRALRTPRVGSKRSARPATSIVVVAHNEGEHLPLTIDGIRATAGDEVEIVVVDDWSTDESVRALDPTDVRIVRPPERGGVVGARNEGARAATGDVLVFADAHVDPVAGWLDAMLDAFADPHVACATPAITEMNHRRSRGLGFTWATPALGVRWLTAPRRETHPIPFACGCLMAFRREDFESVGGFDPGLMRWGSEDAEICLHLWRRDRATVAVPQAQVSHLFRPKGPYEVDSHMIVHNSLRVAAVHLPESCLAKVFEASRNIERFAVAFAELADSDVWARRDHVSASTRHDGAWFVDRFRIESLR